MKLTKSFREFVNSKYIQKMISEKSSKGWVDAQLTDDAAGLDGGSRIMVHGETWKNTEPDKDVEIYSKKSGYVNVPRNFVELSESINDMEFIVEKKISMPLGGFTKSMIEKLLKKHKDIEIVTNSGHWYITPYMHKSGKLDDATEISFFAINKDGEETEIKFKDIKFIEI